MGEPFLTWLSYLRGWRREVTKVTWEDLTVNREEGQTEVSEVYQPADLSVWQDGTDRDCHNVSLMRQSSYIIDINIV